MHDAACHRDDITIAFGELKGRFTDRKTMLWKAYMEATKDISVRSWLDHEQECWSVLQAGLSGIEAEERVVQRDYEARLAAIDAAGAA